MKPPEWPPFVVGRNLHGDDLGECEDCGEPATHVTADGIALCDGDWLELLRMSEAEDLSAP